MSTISNEKYSCIVFRKANNDNEGNSVPDPNLRMMMNRKETKIEQSYYS